MTAPMPSPPDDTFGTLTLEVDGDGVALIRMDLPGRPVNMTTPELTADLMRAFRRVAGDPAIKGAVLTSGKPGGFVAGGDIKDFVNAYERGMPVDEAYELSRESSDFFRAIETCGKPVAAAINGLALGGGLELCLCCHYRVLADDPRAVLGQPEVTIGLLPGGGATQRLPRLIGIERALPLLLGGRHVRPREALELGLVHGVLPARDLVAAAKDWVRANPDARQPWDMEDFSLAPALESFEERAGRLAANGGANYPAPLAILKCVYEGAPLPIEQGLRIESRYFPGLLTGPVARNLMRTTFVNKGLADKLARRPAAVPKAPVTLLGILGEGPAASQVADLAAAAGLAVALARDGSTAGCDLIVHPLHPAEGALTAPASHRGGADVVGIHLSGVAGPALMEIVVDGGAGLRAVARAFDLARQLRLTPVPVYGGKLYTQRLRTVYMEEGARLLAEGMAPESVENAGVTGGMARGPLACAGARWEPRQGAASGARLASAQTRLLTIQALEAARCLEEGVLRDSADADLGALYGCGFPAYTGGPVSLIDTAGVARFAADCALLAALHGPRFAPGAWLLERAASGRPLYESSQLHS